MIDSLVTYECADQESLRFMINGIHRFWDQTILNKAKIMWVLHLRQRKLGSLANYLNGLIDHKRWYDPDYFDHERAEKKK